ncbi:MAG: thioredoxin domain-containing protein [Saprospiraceae bacterium]|nr:thioredoxin domain-containing protein [Saprospiraceae bacterium]
MNRLKQAKSSYLQQHADNPVDWYPWSEEALQYAKRENKPILVSIGYSTCHWCHVMEKESFLDKDIADYMNAFFVNIKIDREERPDLDALYMDACQVLTGEAGWPLHVFLTPDLKPFFAGTYFPPEPGHKKMSWFQALQYAHYNYKEHREKVEQLADHTVHKLEKKDAFPGDLSVSTTKPVADLYQKLIRHFDEAFGGFGTGRKFPHTMAMEALLNHFYISDDEEALNKVRFTINQIVKGGINDQIGGGIARYAVDQQWRVPHFEKMLYDNALFIQVLAKTYKITGRRKYKLEAFKIADFIERDLKLPNGLYVSALDADTEGVEGKFYTWTYDEFEQALGEDSKLFAPYFGVSLAGNWDGVNILYQAKEMFSFARKNGWEVKDFREKLAEVKTKLFNARAERVQPGADKKVITSWNALLASAYLELYTATGETKYRDLAKGIIDQLVYKMYQPSKEVVFRALYDEEPFEEGFLKDYVYLLRVLIDSYQVGFGKKYLEKAEQLLDLIFKKFHPSNGDLFLTSSVERKDVVFAKRDVQDEEMPSGNAVLWKCLTDLSLHLDRRDLKSKAESMLHQMKTRVLADPLAFPSWVQCWQEEEEGTLEIAIAGQGAESLSIEIQEAYAPFKVIAASENDAEEHPLLAHKYFGKSPLIFVCQNYACKAPLNSEKEFFREYCKWKVLASEK